MSQQKDGKTIQEELQAAADELEELSKFYAKKKGRESYYKPAGVASWRKPKPRPAGRNFKAEKILTGFSEYDNEVYHESFVDKDNIELVNMISMLNREPNLLPGGTTNKTPQSIETQTSHDDHDACPYENSKDPDSKSRIDSFKFSPDADGKEEFVERLSKGNSEELVDQKYDYGEYGHPEPTEHFQNGKTSSSTAHSPHADGDTKFSFVRMLRSMPPIGGTKKHVKSVKSPGYRGAVPINGDGEYEKYRRVNIHSYSGRDRLFKPPTIIGSSMMAPRRNSYPSTTQFPLESPPKEKKVPPASSNAPHTFFLTGTDGKLMTGPNAVARLREHQQTPSKLFRPLQPEIGPGSQRRNPKERTQLMVQNLKASPKARTANIQTTSDSFDSLLGTTPLSAPNITIRSPREYPLYLHHSLRIRNKDLSSRSNGSASFMCKTPTPSLETFTIGVGKRPQKAKLPKTVPGTPQAGNEVVRKPSLSIRKSTTKTVESSGSGNFGKMPGSSNIERRNSTGSNRSGPGSGRKRSGKLKSPRVKKSNESTKTEPEVMNFFDNEKFNSLLMKMMAETDTTSDNGPNRILTKKLKMPKS